MEVPSSKDSVSPGTPANSNPWRRKGWRWDCVALLAVLVIMSLVLYPAIQNAREAARRSNCKGELKQIGLALLNYRETYECFPPAYIADANGKPMHSWRVLILPYIDQAALYSEYRFDEPWDGPNNRKLSTRIVVWGDYSFYHCPSDRPASGEPDATMTSYVAVVGPETVWKGDVCVNVDEIADGPESTLMVVEVANSGINWMEPRDLYVLQMASTINPKGGQGVSSRHLGGAHAVTADNSVHFLFDTMAAATLRALLSRSGGETMSNEHF
jgi:hypothetical protein